MMSLSNRVERKMEYIQHVFMQSQHCMDEGRELDKLIIDLDSEPKEFRSVAYESASMMIGLIDIARGESLIEWRKFYLLTKDKHTAHVEVGLGLAMGKVTIKPELLLGSINLVMPMMVFDGIGYYCGLFKGRSTVKNREIPTFIYGQDIHGFDQGLGRRLWYIAKGQGMEVSDLIQSFPLLRQSDLWRGVGIACGYVGGNDSEDLKRLANYSAEFKQHLSMGVAMAALSRSLSESITEDIDLACSILCNKSLQDIILDRPNFKKMIDSGSSDFYLSPQDQINKLAAVLQCAVPYK